MGALIHEDRFMAVTVNVGTLEEVTANTTEELSVTVTGLRTGDVIASINKPTHQAGLGIVGYRVSAANTLAITFMNNTASGITPTASETYKVMVYRPEKTRGAATI